MSPKHAEFERFAPTSPSAVATQNAKEIRSEVPSSPSLSDRELIKLFSPVSTIMYDQEPYDVFSQCVNKLYKMLWLPKKSIEYRTLTTTPSALLRKKKFFGSFFASPQLLLIERLVSPGEGGEVRAKPHQGYGYTVIIQRGQPLADFSIFTRGESLI